MAGHDHFWLSALPTSPNSIQWSQDNLLAIAAGHSVTILNPARLDGARGHTATPTPDLDARLVGCVPRDYHTSAALSKTVLAEARMAESNDRMKLYISSIAWSPMGCSPQGGCLLTTATSDFKVRLYTAPCPKLGSEWQQVLDLTQLYKRILRESMWQRADDMSSDLNFVTAAANAKGVDEASSDLNLVTAANAKVGGGHSPVRQAILPQPLHAQDNLPEPGATGCPDQAPVPQPLHAQDNLPEPGATGCPDQAPVPQPLHAQDNLPEPGATVCPDQAPVPQPLHAQDNLPEPGATGCPNQAPVPQPLHAQDNLPEPGATVCPDQAPVPQPLHTQDNLPEPGATGCPDQAPVPQPLHAQDNLPEPGATVCPDQAPVPQPLHAQDNLQEPGATGCPDEVLRLKGGGATASSDDDVFRLKSGGPAGCTDDGHRLKVRGTARSAADELGLNGRGTAKDTDGVLRLKGGGSSKRKLDKASSSPPDKGDALHHSLCVGDLGEVIVLHVYCVMYVSLITLPSPLPGRLADILGSFGLFEYDELNADETTDAHLKEWFPLPGCIPLTAQELEGHREQYDCHLGPGFLMRPCPPIDLIQRGAPVVPGQFIDAWHDGGWWQTSVISYSSDSDEVHCNLFSGTQQVVVPLSSTRLTTVWSLQGIWSVDSAASIPVKDENTVVDEPKPKRKRPATPKAATEPKSVPPKSTPKVVTEPRAVPSKSTPKSASLPKSVPPT
eukprot:gene28355-31482_t